MAEVSNQSTTQCCRFLRRSHPQSHFSCGNSSTHMPTRSSKDYGTSVTANIVVSDCRESLKNLWSRDMSIPPTTNDKTPQAFTPKIKSATKIAPARDMGKTAIAAADTATAFAAKLELGALNLMLSCWLTFRVQYERNHVIRS